MAASSLSAQEVTDLKSQLRLEKTINEHFGLEVTKLHESLDETKRQLSELQERLHVSEQVTAATQQRAVRENEGIYMSNSSPKTAKITSTKSC